MSFPAHYSACPNGDAVPSEYEKVYGDHFYKVSSENLVGKAPLILNINN